MYFIEIGRALDVFEDDRRDDLVVEEGGAAIGDLMLQRDPQMLRHRLGRRDLAPVGEHRLLHPAQIMGVVDMAHEIDRVGADGDVMVVRAGGGGHGVDIIVNRVWRRSEEHTSELQSLMRISYAVFCLTKKK